MGQPLLDYKAAQQMILDRIVAGDRETVDLQAARGRVLADPLVAGWDLPRHDNSAMDGFAIRADDGAAGAELEITGTVAAGDDAEQEVVPGKAVRIMTGAVIPSGADAVVPVERVEESENRIRLQKKVEKGDHIRWRGEDLRQDDNALTPGVVLCASELGMLATFGHDRVAVYRKPKVAVLATGSELVPPGTETGPAQIHDCNTAALCAAVEAAGGEALPLGIVRDDRLPLEEKVREGLAADMLITAAGASVGEFDLVRDVLTTCGVEEVFWGVSIKPGKPTGFSLNNGKPVFCLPGNPVSALVTFELFARPALLRMTGHRSPLPETVRLPLCEPMKKKPARTLFARVRVVNSEQGLAITSAGSQQTGIMTSLVHADALAVLPDGQSDFASDENVEVILLRGR